jgi:hypothetical protein
LRTFDKLVATITNVRKLQASPSPSP